MVNTRHIATKEKSSERSRKRKNSKEKIKKSKKAKVEKPLSEKEVDVLEQIQEISSLQSEEENVSLNDLGKPKEDQFKMRSRSKTRI